MISPTASCVNSVGDRVICPRRRLAAKRALGPRIRTALSRTTLAGFTTALAGSQLWRRASSVGPGHCTDGVARSANVPTSKATTVRGQGPCVSHARRRACFSALEYHPGESVCRVVTTHPATLHAGVADDTGGNVEPTTYRICVRGQLTERLAQALEGMTLQSDAVNTSFTGEIRNQSALYGFLDRLSDLGLELISVRPHPPPNQISDELDTSG